MFKNYFKTAWRSLRNNKGYAAINILGLAAGMAVALLIGLWVYNEYSYDRWMPGYENLYQVQLNFTNEGKTHTQTAASLPLEEVLRKDIPGVRAVAESDWMGQHNLAVGDKKLYLGGAMTGGEFLSMFRFPLLKGKAETMLQDPYSIVLTQSTARSLFGEADPMNKMVRIDNAHDLKVTGILADLPRNSTLQFNYVIPFSYKEIVEDWVKGARTSWINNSFQFFVQLNPAADRTKIAARLKNVVSEHSESMRPGHPVVWLHAMKDWHLYSGFENGKISGGFIDYVRLFSIIGVLVLAIACVNFINLSTARSEKRAREVGVRKTIGSRRSDLIFQFLTESILTTLIAFGVALLLVEIALPSFNTTMKLHLRVPFDNGVFWALMSGYVLITGLLAGCRPAFYLSSFQPVKVLKGTIRTGRGTAFSRKALVVLQFTCSVGLIITTVVIYRQLEYARNRPAGYARDRLLMTDMSDDLNKNYEPLRNNLLQSGLVESVTAASSPITNIYYHDVIEGWPGKTAATPALGIGAIGIKQGYFKTLSMKILAGRDLTGDYKADSATLLLNESAVRKLNLQQPLGQWVTWGFDKRRFQIVGVVQDAIMESPFTPIAPLMFYAGRGFNNLLYRLKAGVSNHEAVAQLAPLFSKYNPAYPYDYHFVDDEYDQKFGLETLVGRLAALFAGLAIFISCLGLFGLAAYMAERRGKEIGIRKVLGASVPQLWLLLSGDFLLLVVISCVLASPIAGYYLEQWLKKYDYRIHIGPDIFIYSALGALLITLATVSFQSIRAAMANPVRRLRTE